ncbi:hypothetical protein [Vibrio gazogenes]|uniref:AAA ATPase domain-containing protein n=1 Tax=Vibrio gazogenes DSM 21264 = NBRC 103151 TaxID=1123492 RepID=A0A1M5ETC8_VIBGA|nr:hypothetical protein [Vibrio gazogenes]USP14825.1 hypothetical protein MKS89_05815 [Vibrio gazogenes]SHF82508.1 hypothetical protein SAMN02745781_03244 [Vibrio gazogenes DSM 21264] [Vibrio gazogenes DSM 21264 = NBRC 103151]SJN55238.1 hypothetical protein BQ6471_01458 [Vibrio gazogenes]
MSKKQQKNHEEFRTEEMKFIREHFFSSLSDGKLLILQGPSGTGKTHLVDGCFSGRKQGMFIRHDIPCTTLYADFCVSLLKSILNQYIPLIERGRLTTEQLNVDHMLAEATYKYIEKIIDKLTMYVRSWGKDIRDALKHRKTIDVNKIFFSESNNIRFAEGVIKELSTALPFNIAISNAQNLNEKDLEYIFDFARNNTTHQCLFILEFTTNNFKDGIVNREFIAHLSEDYQISVRAITLAPLKWKYAYQIPQHISVDDLWAKNYYERNGFNLFDLTNLSHTDYQYLDSVFFEDITFGPSRIPGIDTQYSATKNKILSLNDHEKCMLVMLGVHGGFIRKYLLEYIFVNKIFHLKSEHIERILCSLQEKKLVVSTVENDTVMLSLIHDSLYPILDNCVELLRFQKISCSCWLNLYYQRSENGSQHRVVDESIIDASPLEIYLRVAYFSSLLGSTVSLNTACRELYQISRVTELQSDIISFYRRISKRVISSNLVVSGIKPRILYFLGAGALNFQAYDVVSMIIENMRQGTFGRIILQIFVDQRHEHFQASNHNLYKLLNLKDNTIIEDDIIFLKLIKVINDNGLAKNAELISKNRRDYIRLIEEARVQERKQAKILKKEGGRKKNHSVLPTVLKHASIGYGYQESLTYIDESIAALTENDFSSIEILQAKLIKAMQLTRVGQLNDALTIIREIKSNYPNNYIEVTNIWNLEAVILCYQYYQRGSSDQDSLLTARELFSDALRHSHDEFRKIVLASNIFIVDHFFGMNDLELMRYSRHKLEKLLENSHIKFRYLYVLGWYNLMKYYQRLGNQNKSDNYRYKIGAMSDHDSLLWKAAMGDIDPTGTEVEFLVSTPFMFAFLPNYGLSAPSFDNREEIISLSIWE